MKTTYQANNLILEINLALERNKDISQDVLKGFNALTDSLENYTTDAEEFEKIVLENTELLDSEQSKAISLLAIDWQDDKVTSKMLKGIIEKQK